MRSNNMRSNNKIKLLFVVSTFRRTGPTNQLLNILKHLDKQMFLPHIVTLSPESGDSMQSEFEKITVQIHSLELSRFQGLLLAKIKLKDLLQQIQPHVIHTQGIRPDILMGSIKDSKHIFTIRNYVMDDYLKKYGNIKGSIMAKCHLKLMRSKSTGVACSKSIQQIYKKSHNILLDVIPNGVDINKYMPVSMDRKKQLRQELNLPDDKKIFISAGSFIKRKNVEATINAFKKQNSLNSYLVILGTGHLENKLKNMCSDDKNILFAGFKTNVSPYLQASDYFISTSYSEGMPNTVLEAMACGLPPILSDIPAHREIFENNSSWQFMAGANDEINLAKCIQSVVNKRYGYLSEDVRKIIVNKFSARQNSIAYQDKYVKISQCQ